jgi:hypothetical protein
VRRAGVKSLSLFADPEDAPENDGSGYARIMLGEGVGDAADEQLAGMADRETRKLAWRGVPDDVAEAFVHLSPSAYAASVGPLRESPHCASVCHSPSPPGPSPSSGYTTAPESTRSTSLILCFFRASATSAKKAVSAALHDSASGNGSERAR